MKRSYKFLVAFLVLALLFSSAAAAVTAFELNSIRRSANEGIMAVISVVKQKYPEVSDNEIARILNSKDSGESYGDSLKKYGISIDRDWALYKNEEQERLITAANTVLCAACCLVICAVFVLYCKMRKKETKRLTQYVERINKKDYDLMIEENSEDEMSLLRNEIYKTTVMLKEQRDSSQRDKESLKDSLSDISHQLKTPLTSILVMLDTILDDDNMPPEIRREFLCDIRRSAASMGFHIQSILTLSKLDADSIILKSNEEDIRRILDECVQNTEVLSELKGVSVSVEVDDDFTLLCDFKWLCEALTNIVKNCIEHTESGGVVSVKAAKTKLYSKITVSDNGEGMSPEDLPHIFERFYKCRNSSNESVGIGLAIAKAIIDKTGGIISVYSTVGSGTTFDIRFFDNRL